MHLHFLTQVIASLKSIPFATIFLTGQTGKIRKTTEQKIYILSKLLAELSHFTYTPTSREFLL